MDDDSRFVADSFGDCGDVEAGESLDLDVRPLAGLDASS